MKINKTMLAAAISSALLMGCDSDTKTVEVERIVEVEKIVEVPVEQEEVTSVKNVILMIGDGMGPQQIGLLEEYARRAPNSVLASTTTGMQKFADGGHVGLSLNAPGGKNGSLVTDSACSATQLATGIAAASEVIGLDDQGNVVETILEKAKAAGKATGLVTDTRITHATPAAFAAHQPHRSFENEIAEDLLMNQVDVLLGGGARHWLPQDTADRKDALAAELGGNTSVIKKSKRSDDRNLIAEARDAGYTLAFDKEQLSAAEGAKLLGLFDDSAMNDGIEYTACKNDESQCNHEPSLREMTLKALDVLSQDEDGFFLMIEGGQIDWAAHVNDTGWMLHELLKFDEAVDAVYEWVSERNDTLVVITADHETGGFGFSYSAHNIPEATTLSGDGMKGENYHPNYNFGSLSTLDKIYDQKASFYAIYDQVNADWDFGASTPEQWQTAVNATLHPDFHIDYADAQAIAAVKPNENYYADHKYLSATQVPAINDFSDFYVYAYEDQGALIARAISSEQSVTWGNGTHTATPVAVYAFGPDGVTKPFSSMLHHTEIGQLMAKALLGAN
ncbi:MULTISPECIES: alkaline phosphatase [unclassified Pseudoalteromonas]|uniref:alkaline phosphatase n=1 Tax=unclassified Pseudoalteromonas TaxID=194690 RepID=UPI001F33F9AE|nr:MULTISPECIES: alkaline phosphatase [unclassified Pseudoalteromonas]